MFPYIFQFLLISFERSKSFRTNLTFFYYLLSFSIYSTRSLNEFYIFTANAQPPGGGEESGHLEKVVNGEFHVFFSLYG